MYNNVAPYATFCYEEPQPSWDIYVVVDRFTAPPTLDEILNGELDHFDNLWDAFDEAEHRAFSRQVAQDIWRVEPEQTIILTVYGKEVGGHLLLHPICNRVIEEKLTAYEIDEKGNVVGLPVVVESQYYRKAE